MNILIAGGIAAVGYYNQNEIIDSLKNFGINTYMKVTDYYINMRESFNYMYVNDYYLDSCKKLVFDNNYKLIENSDIKIHYNNTFAEAIDNFKTNYVSPNDTKTILAFKYYIRLKHVNKEYYYIYGVGENNNLPNITLEQVCNFAKRSLIKSKILYMSYYKNPNETECRDDKVIENTDENDITESFTKYMGPYSDFYKNENIDFRYLYNFKDNTLLYDEKINMINIVFCNVRLKDCSLESTKYNCTKIIE